jgi:hypothetical protein
VAVSPFVNDSQSRTIVASYLAYWDDFTAASDPPSPKAPHLADHATGRALAEDRRALTEQATLDQATRGTYRHQTRVTHHDQSSAEVIDCMTVSARIIDLKTNKTISTTDTHTVPIQATLTLSGEAWKVSKLAPAHIDCQSILAVPSRAAKG